MLSESAIRQQCELYNVQPAPEPGLTKPKLIAVLATALRAADRGRLLTDGSVRRLLCLLPACLPTHQRVWEASTFAASLPQTLALTDQTLSPEPCNSVASLLDWFAVWMLQEAMAADAAPADTADIEDVEHHELPDNLNTMEAEQLAAVLPLGGRNVQT